VIRRPYALVFIGLLAPAVGFAQPLRFDFQPIGGPLAPGFVEVGENELYSPAQGFGFLPGAEPARSVDGTGKTWNFFGRIVTVDQAIPESLLSAATVDALVTESARGDPVEIRFRADLVPSDYDITVWVGDVTRPHFRTRVEANGIERAVTRIDVNHRRGGFDQTVIGGAAPVRLRVAVPDGALIVRLTRDDGTGTDSTFGPLAAGGAPTEWTFDLDESPLTPPGPQTRVLVPGFNGVALQALEIEPVADPPLVLDNGMLEISDAPADPSLVQAVAAYNTGDLESALATFQGLTGEALQPARAAGLMWVAGHPARFGDEPELLGQAEVLLAGRVAADPNDIQARRLLLHARMARDAERYRSLLGYAAAGAPAAENLGRSAALTELFDSSHPYHRKGRILWLRNRGGLDPNRNTVSWERAQWNAGELDPLWGDVNPFVRLYATDEWQNDGEPWLRTNWTDVLAGGPDWAVRLTANLNSWLDLFEWWTIHRQSAEGDIGGGWTDDVEIVPAFGLMALALPDASDLALVGFRRFAEGIWDSGIVDQAAAFQAAFADVEHVAEPSGNLLHISLLADHGDPEAIERILRSTRTFRDVFLSDPLDSPLGHSHFLANHMSSTTIAAGSQFAADIPLAGRVTQPFAFGQWFAGHPGIAEPLERWARSWLEDTQRTDSGKPFGVFPNAVWTPTDEFGFESDGNWWSESPANGQFDGLPARHEYSYAQAGWWYRWTGDAAFLDPFDAIQDHVGAWLAAGSPAVGPSPTAPVDVWAGGKLKARATGPLLNLWSMTGETPAAVYMTRQASGYARYRLDPTDDAALATLEGTAAQLIGKWPYRTTEGVMTDRILVPDWAEVISYYLGADAMSLFTGMPAHAVSWGNTTRRFAAAVGEAAPDRFSATVYRFGADTRTISLRFWQLQPGVDYRIEAGPAAGLGLPPQPVSVDQDFSMARPGDGVSLDIPGQTEFAIRVTPVAEPPPPELPPPPRPDVGIAARDIAYDVDTQSLSLRIHNTGAVDLADVQVTVHAGPGTDDPIVATSTTGPLAAPLDLTPRFVDLDLAGIAPAGAFTAVLATAAFEATLDNNQATAWFGGSVPPTAPPQILALVPQPTEPGGTVVVSGVDFTPELQALDGGVNTSQLQLAVTGPDQAELTLGGAMTAPGQVLLSLATSNGLESNVVPLTIVEGELLFAHGFEP